MGERERAKVEIGVYFCDLAECPWTLEIHGGLFLGECQVAVAITTRVGVGVCISTGRDS